MIKPLARKNITLTKQPKINNLTESEEIKYHNKLLIVLTS